jgi:hypothetical protein
MVCSKLSCWTSTVWTFVDGIIHVFTVATLGSLVAVSHHFLSRFACPLWDMSCVFRCMMYRPVTSCLALRFMLLLRRMQREGLLPVLCLAASCWPPLASWPTRLSGNSLQLAPPCPLYAAMEVGPCLSLVGFLLRGARVNTEVGESCGLVGALNRVEVCVVARFA